MDRIQIERKTFTAKNRFNPGGIKATLQRWYESEDSEKWVSFDGVSVILADSPINKEPYRSLGTVSDLASMFGEQARLTLDEFLYNEF